MAVGVVVGAGPGSGTRYQTSKRAATTAARMVSVLLSIGLLSLLFLAP